MAWVTQSCVAQGVPVKVTDVGIINRVGALLGRGDGASGRGVSTGGRPGPRSQAPRQDDPTVVD